MRKQRGESNQIWKHIDISGKVQLNNFWIATMKLINVPNITRSMYPSFTKQRHELGLKMK